MDIRTLEFNINVTGERRGRGRALIWGHGLLNSMAGENLSGWFCWEDFPSRYKLARYDARGHGKTQPTFSPADYHWANLADDMLAIMDALRENEFLAGGQSMGCATTIYAALKAPERVKGMLLVNPPTAWETRAAQSDLYRRMGRVGGLLGGRMMGRMIARNPERLLPAWLVEAEENIMNAVAAGLKPIKRRTISSLMHGAALTDLPEREKLKDLAMPALILAWDGDASHPLETAEQLNALLPNSELLVARSMEDFRDWPGLIRGFVMDQLDS